MKVPTHSERKRVVRLRHYTLCHTNYALLVQIQRIAPNSSIDILDDGDGVKHLPICVLNLESYREICRMQVER